MLDGVTVVRSEKVKDELVLDGNDIELVSRSAALINQVGIALCYSFFKFHFLMINVLTSLCIILTEMPCQEQGYQKVPGWYLC